jgi:hypothetical protein
MVGQLKLVIKRKRQPPQLPSEDESGDAGTTIRQGAKGDDGGVCSEEIIHWVGTRRWACLSVLVS